MKMGKMEKQIRKMRNNGENGKGKEENDKCKGKRD